MEQTGTLPLEDHFPEEIGTLSELFGGAQVRQALPRLNEIHERCESQWRDYVNKIPGGRVNYLLIGEAPPWTPSGSQVQYVLDPSSRERTLMRAFREAFLPASERRMPTGMALAAFADAGFLIVDSLPFAMKYSSKRRKTQYRALVTLSTHHFLEETLRSATCSWSQNVRVAFSVAANAHLVMGALGNRLTVDKTEVALSPTLVAVNGAGYPDGKRLRELYGIAS